MEINLSAIRRAASNPVEWFQRRFNRGRSRIEATDTYATINSLNSFDSMSPLQKKITTIKLARLAALLALGGVILSVIGFFVAFAWFSRELPKPGEIVRRDGFSTRIYDRNGTLLYDLFDEERRVPITIDQVPENLRNATVAVEDKDFYKHGGFDYLTIVRIPYNYIVRQRVVGGSTLTQQLVKNVFLTADRGLISGPIRKFKEITLSIQIERTFTKDQILEMYLNEAPYGGTAWGVGTASEIYFSKPVSQLTLVESAILAGLPQRPSAYSPYSGKNDENGQPLWKMRAQGVLRRMREDGYITDEAQQEALTQLETIQFQRAASQIKAPHFVFYVRDKLIEMYGEELAERGGFKVTTTLDMSVQEEAEKIVAEEIEKVVTFNITNGSAMVTDPRTGQILSMVGSKDYFSEEIDGQFNVAVDGLRQPGSSIKPLTYLALLQRGYTPASILMDVETTFAANDQEQAYNPKNYDGTFRGPVTVRNALGNSLNIPAVKAMGIVGIDNFLTLAYDMGFPTLEPSQENFRRFGLALTLGGGEVHLIDTVTAYSAFANGGKRVEPTSILKIEDKDGHVVYEDHPVEGKQVIQPEEGFLINSILSDNNARLQAFGANSQLNTGRPIAVKTGTTNEQKDNWTIGWSQEFMVGVWVGNNNSSSMTRVASGITGASPIWRRIVNTLLEKGYKAPDWNMPSNIEQVDVDTVSGYPKHDDFPSRKEYVIKGTLPPLPDPIHSKLKLCRGENKLANDARVASGDFEEKEFFVFKEEDPVSRDGRNRWQEAITAWLNGQSDGRYKPPTEYCGSQGDIFVRLNKPGTETKFDGEEVEVEVEADSGDGIERIEIWVDGGLRETVNDRRYSGKIRLSAGQHEIFAKAKSRGGREAQSGTARIGTGGQDWRRPEATPTPTPTPTPALTPLPTPLTDNGNGNGTGGRADTTPEPTPETD